MEKDNMTRDEMKDFITKTINEALDAREKAKHDALIPRCQVAKIVHKDVSTLNRWEKSGYLVPIRLGKTVMYRSSELRRIGVDI